MISVSFVAVAGGEQEQSGGSGTSTTTESKPAPAPSKYSEAPELAALAKAGSLPPVEDRLPENPMVIEPNHEVGKYGGRLVVRESPQGPYYERSNLLLNRTATETIPNIVEGWEFNSDGTEFTMHLRKGLRWSNGDPCTADDWLFGYYDIDLDETLNTSIPNWAKIGDDVIQMKKIDDYTVKLIFTKPFYGVLNKMNMVGARHYWSPQPKEWLSKYHIKYNPDADKLAAAEGFENWWQYFDQVADREDTVNNFTGEKLGRPELSAWVFKEEQPTAYIYERNPYYYKVDSAGNQLPYIGSVIGMKVDDKEINLMKILNGELDIGGWGLGISDFPALKKGEDTAKYNAWVAPDFWGSATVYCINQTYVGENADVMNPWLQNVKFRRALSLAMNRDEINELVGMGQGVPRAATMHPLTTGYKEEWGTAYAEYDPDRANALLDEIGLSGRDAEGFRTDPDGNTIVLDIPIRPSHTYWIEMTELAQQHWQAVGVKVNVKDVGNNLMQMFKASTQMVFTWALDRMYGPAFIESNGSWLNPAFWNGPIGPLWKVWLTGGGEDGVEPPQLIKDMYAKCLEIQYVSPEEQEAIIEFIGDAYAENVWMIGTVGMIGKPVTIKKDLGNVRDDFFAEGISVPNNQWVQQYYWKSAANRSK